MKIWTRFPFVRLLLPLIAGIIAYRLIPEASRVPAWPLIAGCSVSLAAMLFISWKQTYRTRWLFGFGLNILLVLLGFVMSWAGNQKYYYSHFSRFDDNSRIVYEAFLTEPPTQRANSVKFTLQVRRVSVNGKYFPAKGRIIAYAGKDSLATLLDYGTGILFSDKPQPLKPPSNPGEFDYARYLSVNQVFHQVYLGKGNYNLTGRQHGNFLKSFALRARNRLLTIMQRYGITGREYAVAAALLIGYDDLLDATQRREYSGAGVVHVLCVSGLHVGIVFLIADSLFFFLRKRKKAAWLRPLLIITFIWVYALITGLAPSVMRASLMFSMITIGKSLSRQSHTYNTLAASAFILLIINPGMLYDLGFQLSYGAVFGIVTFQPYIRQLFITTNKAKEYFWSMINVSLAAQLFVTPLSVYYFHQFPNYFLIANLIAIPLSGILIYTGVIFIFLSFIPFLGKIAAVIVVVEIKILNSSVAFIEGLPGAVSHGIYLSSNATILLYLLIFSGFMLFIGKNRFWLYPVLGLCLLLSADFAVTAIGRTDNKVLIVQSINRHTAISFTNGRTQVILADSAVVSKPELIGYSTETFRISAGIREICYTCLSADHVSKSGLKDDPEIRKGFFSFMGKRGVVLTPDSGLPAEEKQIKVDYVILTGNLRQKLEKLTGNFPGAIFIADASNSGSKCLNWSEEAGKLGLPFYSVRESGAWVLKLN
ncbi:MAG: ComEC/Rec2 family competence protein [Lentimicrobium sp.]